MSKNAVAVEETVEVSVMTPYAAAKYVNECLLAAGIDKVVPPQMMYNYTKARLNADKKPLIKYTLEGGIDREDLDRWVVAYAAKLVAKKTETETVDA